MPGCLLLRLKGSLEGDFGRGLLEAVFGEEVEVRGEGIWVDLEGFRSDLRDFMSMFWSLGRDGSSERGLKRGFGVGLGEFLPRRPGSSGTQYFLKRDPKDFRELMTFLNVLHLLGGFSSACFIL